MAYLLSASTGNMCDGEGFSATVAGSANYISVANPTVLSGASTMSLSFWAKKTANTNTVICGKEGAAGQSWHMSFQNGFVRVYSSNSGSDAYGDYTMTNDTNLHHFVMVFDGAGSTNADKLKLYVDGTNQTLTFTGTVGSTLTTNTGTFRIARASNGTAIGSDGSFAQVDLFTSAISSSNVTTLYNSGSGITDAQGITGHLAGWRFREGAGSTAFSYGLTPDTYAGTYTGSVTRSTGLIYDNTDKRFALCNSTFTLDSEAGTSSVTTSVAYSTSGTPGAGVILDGIAVKIATVSMTPTGTTTLVLRNVTDSTDERTVTINASDLSRQTFSATSKGWAFFKFSSSFTTAAAKAYAVGLSASSNGQVTVYTNGTANNWARLFRTTTTQCPAIADSLVFCGELTGQGTGNDITITANNIEPIYWGTSSAVVTSLHIGYRGVFKAPTSGDEIYYFATVQNASYPFEVASGGTLELGSPSTPLGSNTFFSMPTNISTNVDGGYVVLNGGTIKTGCPSKDYKTYLSSDVSSGTNTCVVNSVTGWKIGDEIVVSSTTRTSSQAEKRTITNIVGTTVTVNSNWTNNHTALNLDNAVCYVFNITRNVKIYGRTSSLQTYFRLSQYPADVDIDGLEIYYAGSATTDKRGFDCQIIGDPANVANIKGMSFHDSTVASSIPLTTSASFNNALIQDFCAYNTNVGISISATTGTNVTLNNIYAVTLASGNGITISDVGITMSGDIISSSATSNGISISESAGVATTQWGTMITHSCGSAGLNIASNTKNLRFTGTRSWRNTGSGATIASSLGLDLGEVNFFGNTTNNIQFTGSSSGQKIRGGALSGDTTFSTTNGINFSSAGVYPDFRIYNTIFSKGGGIRANHTQDINVSGNAYYEFMMHDTQLLSSTEVANTASMDTDSYIASQNHDGVAGSIKIYRRDCLITSDTGIADSGTSLRFTPSSATVSTKSDYFDFPVTSGENKAVYWKVRCSVSGDGAAYNGTRPRLILAQNNSVGITADTVLDTATASSDGAFETLTGNTGTVSANGVARIYIDNISGTTGWVNIDSVSREA